MEKIPCFDKTPFPFHSRGTVLGIVQTVNKRPQKELFEDRTHVVYRHIKILRAV